MTARLPKMLRLAAAATLWAALLPAVAHAAPPVPAPAAAFTSVTFVEGVAPELLPHDVYVEWPLVSGAGAYEVRSVTGSWSFRCEPLFTTPVPGDPRIPSVRGVPLSISWQSGANAQWRLPLGSVASSLAPGVDVLFPEGSTDLEIRALPSMGSSLSEASAPATLTVRWLEQSTRSTIAITGTPWGVKVVRSTTTAGDGLIGTIDGVLEASRDNVIFFPVDQYTSGGIWSPVTRGDLGADPTVWPRYGEVAPGRLTYGRFRVAATELSPGTRSMWYRQIYRGGIREVDGTFVRLRPSTAIRRYTPKGSPELNRISASRATAGKAIAWTATLDRSAASKARVRWRLYQQAPGASSTWPPERAWILRKSGAAGHANISWSRTRYRVAIKPATPGRYRLDVFYPGSSAARPDGYSRIIIVR